MLVVIVQRVLHSHSVDTVCPAFASAFLDSLVREAWITTVTFTCKVSLIYGRSVSWAATLSSLSSLLSPPRQPHRSLLRSAGPERPCSRTSVFLSPSPEYCLPRPLLRLAPCNPASLASRSGLPFVVLPACRLPRHASRYLQSASASTCSPSGAENPSPAPDDLSLFGLSRAQPLSYTCVPPAVGLLRPPLTPWSPSACRPLVSWVGWGRGSGARAWRRRSVHCPMGAWGRGCAGGPRRPLPGGGRRRRPRS